MDAAILEPVVSKQELVLINVSVATTITNMQVSMLEVHTPTT